MCTYVRYMMRAKNEVKRSIERLCDVSLDIAVVSDEAYWDSKHKFLYENS